MHLSGDWLLWPLDIFFPITCRRGLPSGHFSFFAIVYLFTSVVCQSNPDHEGPRLGAERYNIWVSSGDSGIGVVCDHHGVCTAALTRSR